jgi:hypothetical protein
MNTLLPRSAALGLLFIAPLASTADAQELFGRWEDTPSDFSFELFIDPTAPGPGSPNNPLNPYRTISAALNFITNNFIFDPGTGLDAQCQPTGPGSATANFRFTLNLAPGLYSQSNGESFPIRLPAHGFSVEAWPFGGDALYDRPVIDPGNGLSPWTCSGDGFEAILIDWVGSEDAPATVIQGLEIRNANPGIRIDPSLIPGQVPALPAEPLAVEVRNCWIHDCQTGIEIGTAEGFTSTHVIEDNDVGDDTPILGPAIEETNSGFASTLYRSNRIQLYEEGIRVSGNGSERTAPRLFSNFIQLGERMVNLFDCRSFLTNNTVAYAVDFTAVPVVNGVTISGGSARLANNLIWCPDTPTLVPAIDLDILGGAAVTQVTNLVEDTATLTPLLAGGDAHPGFTPVDLHLTAASPMIGAGTNAMVFSTPLTVLSEPLGGLWFRTDVSVDNDLDGRAFLSIAENDYIATQVDIGGDEFLALGAGGRPECRIELAGGPLVDQFGNVLPVSVAGNDRTWAADFELGGPAGGLWFLYLGFGFFDDTIDPAIGVSVPNGSIYQNTVASALLPGIAPTLGNVLFDFFGPSTNVSAGIFGPNGTADLPNFPLGSFSSSLQELEWPYQILTFDFATGRFAASNRLKVELNVGP